MEIYGIQKLQLIKNEIVKSDSKLSDLLRGAKIIAKEIKDDNFLKWIEKELNGYSNEDKIPDYRNIKGEPKGWNPYYGWVPLIMNKPDLQEIISERKITQSVEELEELIFEGKEGELQVPFPEKFQHQISQSVGTKTKFTLIIPRVAVVKILNSVRNKLLDWIIEISERYGKSSSNVDESGNKKPSVFPNELIEKLPKDLKILCDDFNFNFVNQRPVASMLILRRLLPLSIVRKFQQINKESEIKDKNGEYFDTKKLLGKAEKLLSNKRIYKELMNYKILIDSAQHSYSINIQLLDVEGVAITIRAFLDEIF